METLFIEEYKKYIKLIKNKENELKNNVELIQISSTVEMPKIWVEKTKILFETLLKSETIILFLKEKGIVVWDFTDVLFSINTNRDIFVKIDNLYKELMVKRN